MENKEKFEQLNEKIKLVFSEIWKKIVWQENLIRDLVIALLSRWHILLEWAPWLAKTLSVDTLSKTLGLKFNRIQFTPDLLPSDLIWAKIYDPEAKSFFIKHWPIFSNFVLADEINRAPSKVQSALLEAMAEGQVTIWEESFKLEKPFIVLATQNPIEQSGTFDLPEAQLDRFLLKTIVDYPSKQEEIKILKQSTSIDNVKIEKILSKKDVLEAQNLVKEIYVDDNILNYISDIVSETRNNKRYGDIITYGVSPRASIWLLQASKVLALISGREFVIPEDIKNIAKSVLRHRLILSYEALADNITEDEVVERILGVVKVR